MDVILAVVAVLNLLGALIGLALAFNPATSITGMLIAGSGIGAAALFGDLAALLREITRIRRAVEVQAMSYPDSPDARLTWTPSRGSRPA
jgi:hypothetical protein